MYTGKTSSIPPECRFIKTNGRRCHSPSIRGMAYCYFHQPSRRRATGKGRPQTPITLELAPDDGRGQSYRNSLAKLRQAVDEGRLDHLKADLCFYAINIVAGLPSTDPDVEPPADSPTE